MSVKKYLVDESLITACDVKDMNAENLSEAMMVNSTLTRLEVISTDGRKRNKKLSFESLSEMTNRCRTPR